MAKTKGFVTTVCGRKRRLPDMQLPEYSISYTKEYTNATGLTVVPKELCDSYTNKLNSMYNKQRNEFIRNAIQDGLYIKNNNKLISDATRQCVNSRIQGSAADLTKIAMIELNKSERLKELGFRMLIPVHDEIIAECPEENIKECSELLASTMCSAAEKILGMPINCDVEITKCWYGEKLTF